jgi:hypothetical protein
MSSPSLSSSDTSLHDENCSIGMLTPPRDKPRKSGTPFSRRLAALHGPLPTTLNVQCTFALQKYGHGKMFTVRALFEQHAQERTDTIRLFCTSTMLPMMSCSMFARRTGACIHDTPRMQEHPLALPLRRR